jgi:hypothetical protein
MITQDELNEIQARADAATPGEWAVAKSKARRRSLMRFNEQEGYSILSWKGFVTTSYERDSIFIAHARADVPRLVEEVRRLQSELAALNPKA